MSKRKINPLELKQKARLLLVFLLLCSFSLLIIVRLFMIQVMDVESMKDLAEHQAVDTEIIPASRGKILDRNYQVLATNQISYDIGGRIIDLPQPNKTFQLLGKTFHRNPDYYYEKFTNPKTYNRFEKSINLEQAEILMSIKRHNTMDPALSGIRFDEINRRLYPLDATCGHVIGFTGTDNKGLAGLEKQYDNILSGQNGSKMVKRDLQGKIVASSSKGYKSKVDGCDVILTFDMNYQIILEEELQKAVQGCSAEGGMGILMNPNTGEILAMANYPDFDPNNYSSAPAEVRRNRAITDQFEPGSVFKIVPISAALENNLLDKDSKINCENGSWKIYDRTLHDTHEHEWLTVTEILTESSNIGAAKIAQKCGNDKLYSMAKRFGIGDPTNINLVGESSGNLAHAAEWHPISSSQIAIGHNVTTTLVQLACAYSAIANGGTLLKPYIIKSFRNANGKYFAESKPVVVRRVISEKTAGKMRLMLEEVVSKGTGSNAQIQGYRVAGKTGTAQKVIDGKYSDRDYMASFVSFFPANKPVLVCAITIDSPVYGKHFGSSAAAPAVKNVFSRIINTTDFNKLYHWIQEDAPMMAQTRSTVSQKLSIHSKFSPVTAQGKSETIQPVPVKSEVPTQSIQANGGMVLVPDLKGRAVKSAKYIIAELDLNCTVIGKGTKIISQLPEPGTSVSPQTLCTLILDAVE